MTQKTISLPEDTYNKLKAKKRKKETFPDLILRLLGEKTHEDPKPIEKFFGAFEEESDEWGEIEKNLYDKRNQQSGRITH